MAFLLQTAIEQTTNDEHLQRREEFSDVPYAGGEPRLEDTAILEEGAMQWWREADYRSD